MHKWDFQIFELWTLELMIGSKVEPYNYITLRSVLSWNNPIAKQFFLWKYEAEVLKIILQARNISNFILHMIIS